MFKVIRTDPEYDLLIAVSPADAGPDTPDAEYFRYSTAILSGQPSGRFNPIPRDTAMMYFTGISDGLGHGELPTEAFETMDDILAWRKSHLPIYEDFYTKKSTLSDAILDVEDRMRSDQELRHLLRHQIASILFRADLARNDEGERLISISFNPQPTDNAPGDKLFLGW